MRLQVTLLKVPTEIDNMANCTEMLSRKLKNNLRNLNTFKAIIIILLWQFGNNIIYFIYLKPSEVMRHSYGTAAVLWMITLEAGFSILSPLAGLIADVAYGRLRVLKFSTYLIVACTFGVLVMLILLNATEVLVFRYVSIIFFFGSYLGRVFFQANIIQFGTDQLRDMPTDKSVRFIHMYVWSHAVTYLLTNVVCSTSHVFDWYNIQTHTSTIVLLDILLSFSSIFLIGMLFVIDKVPDLFHDERLKVNPYKLLFRVIKFTVKHKKPIKRSAFTYCDEEIPSRIDYGKLRYGGPFTTEQVEDVKVLLSILIVLVSLGPAFILDFNVNIILQFYIRENEHKQTFLSDTVKGVDLTTSLITILSLPVLYFIIKPIFNRLNLGMFKRMGLSMIVMTSIFVICFIINTIGSTPLLKNSNHCFKLNHSVTFNQNLTRVPVAIIPITVQIMHVFYTMLEKISVLEFISCQTPQHMKGIVFGMYYFIQSLFLLLSVFISYYFFSHFNVLRDAPRLNCPVVYYTFNILIGILCLIIFTISSRRYKYRRRDDICNVYQYAEDYYSNCNLRRCH